MKFIIAILSIAFISNSAHAALLDFPGCLNDHKSILYRHAYQIHTQNKRLISGIGYEKNIGAPAGKIKALTSLLGRSIIKEYVIHDVIRQINIALHNPKITANPQVASFANNIINTDEIALNTDISRNRTNPAAYLLKTYKNELSSELILDLGEEVYHALGNGTVMKLISGTIATDTIESALISFGSGALKGAGISAALTLIATPLMGARLSPEDLWIQMLDKRPELIVNPEWMNEAGIPDAPWFAHCLAIKRKEKQIKDAVSRLNDGEETAFLNKIAQIEKKFDLKTSLSKNVAVRDNTYVYTPKTIEQQVPLWAILK